MESHSKNDHEYNNEKSDDTTNNKMDKDCGMESEGEIDIEDSNVPSDDKPWTPSTGSNDPKDYDDDDDNNRDWKATTMASSDFKFGFDRTDCRLEDKYVQKVNKL